MSTADDIEPEAPDAWMQWRFASVRSVAGAEGSVGYERYEFARHQAPALAEAAVGSGVELFRPPRPISRRTVLFRSEGDTALVAVVGAQEALRDVELTLPLALQVIDDRDLVLVLPAGSEWPMLARLPWLDQHTRVFTHANGVLSEHVVPLRSDVREAVVAGTAPPPYELSATHAGWADEIIAWADGHPRLVASHRSSYLAWQVDGRKVLEIRRTGNDHLRIAAGVRPGSDSAKASGTLVELDGPLAQPGPIREAVRHAIAARLEGDDDSHLEHRLQARLLQLDQSDRLGLEMLLPEFPAMRPRPEGYARGFIDFLGVDGDGRIHVVETKVGASETTVALQALDYWVWAESNRETLAEELGADPSLPSALCIVVLPGDDGRLLHRQNEHVIERFARSVPLRVWAAEADLGGALRLSEAHFGAIRAGRRWSSRMRRRAISAVALAGARPASSSEPFAGLSAEAHEHASDLADRGELHGYVHQPHSSQRFALELFGAVTAAGSAELLARTFGPIKHASAPSFEWADPEDLLGESTPTRPNRTTVDVVLEGHTIDGRHVALLIEVKLTEVAFGDCSHSEVAPADARHVCAQSGPFGSDPITCWQLRNRDQGDRRQYDHYLSVRPDAPVGPGCWFREVNQPMRNAALASALVKSGRFDDCVVALTTPVGHVSIRRRWAEATAMFEPGLLTMLDPEMLLGQLELETSARLIDRYGLGAPTGVATATEDQEP